MLLPSYSRGRLGAQSLVIEVQSPDVSSQVGVVAGPEWRGARTSPGRTALMSSWREFLSKLRLMSYVVGEW